MTGVGDQDSGPAYHRMPPTTQPGLSVPTWWWPRGPSSLPWPRAGLARAQWRPLGRFSGVCPRPLGRRLACCSLGLGAPDRMNPGGGGESAATLTPGFWTPLPGGRRQKKPQPSAGSDVAQLCDHGSVTSSLWASSSMNRSGWHLFPEVVKRMSPSSPQGQHQLPHLPSAALDASHRSPATGFCACSLGSPLYHHNPQKSCPLHRGEI